MGNAMWSLVSTLEHSVFDPSGDEEESDESFEDDDMETGKVSMPMGLAKPNDVEQAYGVSDRTRFRDMNEHDEDSTTEYTLCANEAENEGATGDWKSDDDDQLSAKTAAAVGVDGERSTTAAVIEHRQAAGGRHRQRQRKATAAMEVRFECQLAHGSPTGRVGGVKRIDQLYKMIADCYAGVHVDDILYCTVNTHQVDMTRLLSGRIDRDDFIFAHVKGPKTELEFVKKSPNLGLTISDNGVGKCFIKKIVEGSLGQTLEPAVTAGDVIEKINGISTLGMRHFEVAKLLRALPLNEMIKLRVIKPLQSGFSFVSSRRASGRKQAMVVGDGLETLRFKSTGEAVVQMAPSSLIIEHLNAALEKYLGISDDDLALTVWELCKDLSNSAQLVDAVAKSDLADFRIPEELIFEMWGVVSDWNAGRLMPVDGGDAPMVTEEKAPSTTEEQEADQEKDGGDSASKVEDGSTIDGVVTIDETKTEEEEGTACAREPSVTQSCSE